MIHDNEHHRSFSGLWYADSEPVRIEWSDGYRLRKSGPHENERASWIAPGLLDIQVNGYDAVDYSGPNLTTEGMDHVIQSLTRSGTTRHAPTLITNSQERICANLSLMASAVQSSDVRRDAILGFHVEGPFISPENGPRGAHDPQFIRDPSWSEAKEWIEAAAGLLSIVTLAPERPGAEALIERLVGEGIVVAIGHTAASREDIIRAVAAGATLSTHLGNGSHATLPRLDNYVLAQLAEDRLIASIIGDGYHLPTDALKVITRAKSPGRCILVSDVSPLGGTSPGVKSWGNMRVEVHADGHISLESSPFLAGSGHLLHWDLVQVMKHSDWTMSEAITACTHNVLQLLGRSLPNSEPDDVIRFALQPESEALEVTQTVRAGKLVFDAAIPE